MDEHILNEFLDEAQSSLKEVESEIVLIKSFTPNKELVERLARKVHTIKGACGFFGFSQIEEITHFMESQLELLRENTLGVDLTLLDPLQNAVDELNPILDEIQKSGKEPKNFHSRLNKQEENASADQDASSELEIDPVNSHLEELSREIQSGKEIDLDVLEAVLDSALDFTPKKVEQYDLKAPQPKEVFRAIEPALFQKQNYLRVETCQLDQITELSKELNEYRDKKNQSVLSRDIDSIIDDFQSIMMKVNQQPIGKLFGMMPNLVRNLGDLTEKQVQLEIYGGSVLVDRKIISVMMGPLTHMIRNSIDHGIESQDVRIEANKKPSGKLELRAVKKKNGFLSISLRDDGAGLDVNRILDRAILKGIVTKPQSKLMSHREIFELIFAPGFTTCDEPTEISGRGIGMDAVKHDVEQLAGTIEVDSELGSHTIFTILIPIEDQNPKKKTKSTLNLVDRVL